MGHKRLFNGFPNLKRQFIELQSNGLKLTIKKRRWAKIPKFTISFEIIDEEREFMYLYEGQFVFGPAYKGFTNSL